MRTASGGQPVATVEETSVKHDFESTLGKGTAEGPKDTMNRVLSLKEQGQLTGCARLNWRRRENVIIVCVLHMLRRMVSSRSTRNVFIDGLLYGLSNWTASFSLKERTPEEH